jgi:O-antigen ligase
MRPYFWKAALAAISGQVWMGVGTGDVQKAMNESYVRTQSPLHEEWYKRPHNQLITITLALGLTGLLIFLLSLFYPLYFLRKDLPLLYWVFFVVLFLSFLMEDTLETQAGQTFYAFFNTLFLSAAWFRRQQRSVTH